jgi:2,3-bisphosphoglycerate-independent phosphoglycerate mutase
MATRKPVVLLVLDGWGHALDSDFNAITRAPAENFLSWWENSPKSLLSACGKEVGLPLGLMGNSEVGHTNIGAGRVVRQTISRIDHDLENGDFVRNPALRGAVQHALTQGSRLHLFGLIGPGGVHASDGHYQALLALADDMGLPSERVMIHALLDGRDTPPRSAAGFMRELNGMLEKSGGQVASVCGRFFGMDRDNRWERTQRFWDLVIHGKGHHAATVAEAMQLAQDRGESDEFVEPTLVGEAGRLTIQDQDAVLGFNFRADRVRQFSEALLFEDFSGFDRGHQPEVHFATMTQYRDDFPCPVAFPPLEIQSSFGELVAAKGLRQFRCAETEKYAHVTFFFNGGREALYEGEERHLVASPKVVTYDLQPEMSAEAVTDAVVDRLRRGGHDLYIVNFANADMVGHTGIQSAAEAAVRFVDGCLKRIVDETRKQGGMVAITADHGNSEQMVDPVTLDTHTAHTLNPVPFLLLGDAVQGVRLRENGVLADVAPTLMEAMGIAQPDVMDGRSLFSLRTKV